MPKKSVVTITPKRERPVLICRKCVKRAVGGKALKNAIGDEVRHAAQTPGLKRSKVVLTSCFGICPKHAVVVTSGPALSEGKYMLVDNRRNAAEAVTLLMRKIKS